MPIFAVHALDNSDALPLRLEHYAAHRAFIEAEDQFGVSVLLSGPLQSDDGELMIGSLFVVEAETRALVDAFNQADPFFTAGVWGQINIHRFHKRKG